LEAARNFLEQAAVHDLVSIQLVAVQISCHICVKFYSVNHEAELAEKLVRYLEESTTVGNHQSPGGHSAQERHLLKG